MTSFTCSSTCLNGSTLTLASSIAISMRFGGCGSFVCGFIAFREMKVIIWLRFISTMCFLCSAVR